MILAEGSSSELLLVNLSRMLTSFCTATRQLMSSALLSLKSLLVCLVITIKLILRALNRPHWYRTLQCQIEFSRHVLIRQHSLWWIHCRSLLPRSTKSNNLWCRSHASQGRCQCRKCWHQRTFLSQGLLYCRQGYWFYWQRYLWRYRKVEQWWQDRCY